MRSINRVFRLSVALIFSVFSLVTGAAIADAFVGQTTRVSVSSAGVPASLGATFGALSADGQFAVFQSSAPNVVIGVTGTHVYRHDRLTRETVLVDVAASDGVTASTGPSLNPTISEDGTFVAFGSFANDLVTGSPNSWQDVFVRDMRPGGLTKLVSASSTSEAGNLSSSLSTLDGVRQISYDGRYVVFGSIATNLASGTNNGKQQIYRKDMDTLEVVRVSVNDAGDAGNASSQMPTISGNGRVVAFQSASTNLVSTASDTPQIFVRDLFAVPATTTLESPGAAVVRRTSSAPALSFFGRYVAFESAAVLDPRDRDNGMPDIYLRDRSAPGSTVIASLSLNNLVPPFGARSIQASISGDEDSISEDGRWVSFASQDEMFAADDLNGRFDVFVYDRTTEAVTLVSRNDEGVPANADSLTPSISSDGRFVLFGSTASNLASASNGLNQLYVRCTSTNAALCSLVPNSAPVINAGSDETVPAGTSLNRTGSFSDADASSSWTATVDYGTGAIPLPLAADKTFSLTYPPFTPGTTQVVTVSVTDDAGATGSDSFSFVVRNVTHSIEWLAPMSNSFTVGRNLPVKFFVRAEDGSAVLDESVRVDVVDLSSGVVVRTYSLGTSPSRSVTWNGVTYHVNVDTRDLEPGMYQLRVRFSSATLTGVFTLDTNGTANAVRSRLRD